MKPKPNKYGQINMRGFKKVYMVTVLEGDGTNDYPYFEAHYIFDDETDEYLGFVSREDYTEHNL